MSGADTILSVMFTILFVLVMVVITGVFVQVSGPVLENVVDGQLMTDLGWGVPGDTVLLFAALALIAMMLIIFIWWITKPVREDVRQEQTRGGF
jgi:uncharacterized BrkB/YihY/UPF0761 family membrane protein